jgi:cold shock CspA family protein
VKWFKPEKGFGFVEIADGSGDAFLSVKALQAMGRDTVSPGAKLNVFVGQGEKGRHISTSPKLQRLKIAANQACRPTAPPPIDRSAWKAICRLQKRCLER